MFLLFIYHSFHFLCYYLKFSIFDFMYFLTGLFPHAFSRLSLFGTTLMRDRFDSRVYICRIFFVLFVPGYSAITICFSWTFICRDLHRSSSHQSTRHQSISFTSHQSTRCQSTSHQSPRCQSTRHQSPVNQSPVTSQPGTSQLVSSQ